MPRRTVERHVASYKRHGIEDLMHKRPSLRSWVPEHSACSPISCLPAAQLVALAEAFGGTRVYVPKNIGASHPIAEAIGIVAAQALLGRIGNENVRIPLARDLRARYYCNAGVSLAQIARRLGMSEVGVQRLLKRIGRA